MSDDQATPVTAPVRGLLPDEYFDRICRNPELRLKVDDSYAFLENLIDIPYDVVLGNADFQTWQAGACRQQQEISDRIPLSPPTSLEFIKEYENAYGHMQEYRLNWDPDNPLHGSVFGGTLARPRKYDARKPLIIFIHGHGMVRNYSGEYRSDLFAAEDVANAILKRGYAVWAPDNVYHDELIPLFAEHDFPDMWAKVDNQSWELLRPYLPETKRRYIIGLACGASTGISMVLTNRDMDGFVAAGSFFSLDLLRRDYRIKGHPLCVDFRHFASYLPLYAMALDRPLQIQEGRDDGLWAGHPNLPHEWYSGLKRPVLTEESLGPMLILERLAQQVGNPYSFILSDRGHERMDFGAALAFIAEVERA